ncbi:hypothetical protein Lal_00000808 [Lupinus albus]|nr:hypothetical protein Lal_00000808 [Lupinus albus]
MVNDFDSLSFTQGVKRVYNVSKDSLLRSPERGLRKITPARGPKPGIPSSEED